MTENPSRRDQPQHIVDVPASINMVALLGPNDEHLSLIETGFDADVHVRGNRVTLRGESSELALAERLIDELVTILRTGQGLTPEIVERAIGMLRAESHERPADVLSLNILSNRGRTIRPKTLNQKRYVDAIDKHTVVFGIGPAGTGKTYLAMAKAVQALQSKNVTRIILTRPAVEAGERLGFLPGTLSEKIDPYLRPLYDALHDMIDPETIPKLLAAGTIEVAPLAYMRGRAQPLDSLVATPDGFRPIGSLQVGDLVVGRNGLPTPVLGVHPQGVKDVFRVTTQDGASTLACGEHLWTVRDGGSWVTVQTHDVAAALTAGRSVELPLVEAVEFVPQRDIADPRALGQSLAEDRGGSESPGDSRTPRSVATLQRIPLTHLVNEVAVRRSLLAGLIDGSGHTDEQGRCLVTVPEAALRADVVWLVRSLGGVALDQGSGVLEVRGAGHGLPPMRFVDSIEPEGRVETVCISVAAEDSLYVTDDFLVTHNTLNDAFIILDEAQNTSPEQMKMFLTRLGFGSKIVVTGDVTQVDLPGGIKSGLKVVEGILGGIEDISFNRLTSHDVVRHRLVGKIVAAYDTFEARDEGDPGADGGRDHHRPRGRRS